MRRTAIRQESVDKQLTCPHARTTTTRQVVQSRWIAVIAHAAIPEAGQRFIPDIRAKSPITFCIDSNAEPPDDITPCIAETTFCICVMSGIMAIAAFACLTPGTPDIWFFHQREQPLLDLDDQVEHLAPVGHRPLDRFLR